MPVGFWYVIFLILCEQERNKDEFIKRFHGFLIMSAFLSSLSRQVFVKRWFSSGSVSFCRKQAPEKWKFETTVTLTSIKLTNSL